MPLTTSTNTSCVYVLSGTPNALASPKSASFKLPSRSIRRFCGFRSRCRMRWLWQYRTPSTSWLMNFFTIASPRPIRPMSACVPDSCFPRPPSLTGKASMYFFKSRSKNSNTRYNLWPSAWTMLRSRTMFGSFISFSSEISRIAVLGTPSSSASRRIFFKATIRVGCVRSRAL